MLEDLAADVCNICPVARKQATETQVLTHVRDRIVTYNIPMALRLQQEAEESSGTKSFAEMRKSAG